MRYFIIISIFLIILGVLTKSLLDLDNLILDNLSTSITRNQLIEYLDFKKKMAMDFIYYNSNSALNKNNNCCKCIVYRHLFLQ